MRGGSATLRWGRWSSFPSRICGLEDTLVSVRSFSTNETGKRGHPTLTCRSNGPFCRCYNGSKVLRLEKANNPLQPEVDLHPPGDGNRPCFRSNCQLPQGVASLKRGHMLPKASRCRAALTESYSGKGRSGTTLRTGRVPYQSPPSRLAMASSGLS